MRKVSHPKSRVKLRKRLRLFNFISGSCLLVGTFALTSGSSKAPQSAQSSVESHVDLQGCDALFRAINPGDWEFAGMPVSISVEPITATDCQSNWQAVNASLSDSSQPLEERASTQFSRPIWDFVATLTRHPLKDGSYWMISDQPAMKLAVHVYKDSRGRPRFLHADLLLDVGEQSKPWKRIRIRPNPGQGSACGLIPNSFSSQKVAHQRAPDGSVCSELHWFDAQQLDALFTHLASAGWQIQQKPSCNTNQQVFLLDRPGRLMGLIASFDQAKNRYSVLSSVDSVGRANEPIPKTNYSPINLERSF